MKKNRYEVMVAEEFSAAHKLNQYPGNCANIHGHTWRIELYISGNKLDEIGMLIDFRQAKSVLSEVIKSFDHQFINSINPFNQINPTAENLASYIYDQVKLLLPDYNIAKVKVWESSSSCVSYSEGAE